MLGGPTYQENVIELIGLPLLYHRYTYKSKKDNTTVEVDGYAAVSVTPALIAQHTHDSRYRIPHFPDATELPLSGALAKRLGDRIKMVAEAEAESGSEDEEELTE